MWMSVKWVAARGHGYVCSSCRDCDKVHDPWSCQWPNGCPWSVFYDWRFIIKSERHWKVLWHTPKKRNKHSSQVSIEDFLKTGSGWSTAVHTWQPPVRLGVVENQVISASWSLIMLQWVYEENKLELVFFPMFEAVARVKEWYGRNKKWLLWGVLHEIPK